MVTDKSFGFSSSKNYVNTGGTSVNDKYQTTTVNDKYQTHTWTPPLQGDRGWICPRCNKVNAPWVRSCDCPGYSTTWISYTSSSPDYDNYR